MNTPGPDNNLYIQEVEHITVNAQGQAYGHGHVQHGLKEGPQGPGLPRPSRPAARLPAGRACSGSPGGRRGPGSRASRPVLEPTHSGENHAPLDGRRIAGPASPRWPRPIFQALDASFEDAGRGPQAGGGPAARPGGVGGRVMLIQSSAVRKELKLTAAQAERIVSASMRSSTECRAKGQQGRSRGGGPHRADGR